MGKKYLIYEYVGDRCNRSLSFSEIAYTLQANAQSKDQHVIEYEEDSIC